MININEMLAVRDGRWKIKNGLLRRFNTPVISFYLNIPGPIKDTLRYRRVHQIGWRELLLRLANIEVVVYQKVIYRITGPEGYLCVDNDSHKLKEIAVAIEEEHPLGRIFDIDIMSCNGLNISRKDMGKTDRKCLLCNENVLHCMKKGSHTYRELIERIDRLLDNYVI